MVVYRHLKKKGSQYQPPDIKVDNKSKSRRIHSGLRSRTTYERRALARQFAEGISVLLRYFRGWGGKRAARAEARWGGGEGKRDGDPG